MDINSKGKSSRKGERGLKGKTKRERLTAANGKKRPERGKKEKGVGAEVRERVFMTAGVLGDRE